MFKDLVAACKVHKLIYIGDQTRHLNYVNNMLGKWSDCTQFFLV